MLFVVMYMSFVNVVQGQKRKIHASSKLSVASLNGCWKRISVITDGKPGVEPLQLRIFSDGFYTYIGQDTAQNWTRTFAGTYEIDNNLYKETTQYSSVSDIIGLIHWQEIKIIGDTLRLKFYNKRVDAKGNELPKPASTREVVLVKMKK
jgi:hypothetical protein